ncbi:MAG: ZPR1 zinc finger domain-containing protein [Candidatus Poseidoniales archaeon]|jgi:zinc finger protein|nr:ZPR1 zinc finger domain-containing protein [Candidatus Poseidoniales archaeon]|tara:strand:- start:730 stop:1323 length:594 start_codon:yes stop_codon:yes gene_type:complete
MESTVEQPCPICFSDKGLTMIAHSSEIPYFGEHTQLTILCPSCGWRHTDFIPAEGKKPGAWSLEINNRDMLSVRIVRSSSCTVKISELGLEVEPGGATTGYVSNIEGVLNRFEDAIRLMYRQSKLSNEEEIIENCERLLEKINQVKEGELNVMMTLLDPMGHSQILHAEAVSRNLTEQELNELEVGPSVPVFNSEDL